MPGDEQSSSPQHWYQEDSTRIILATFAAIAVAAGSHIWHRSHSHSPMASPSPPASPRPAPQDGTARTPTPVDTSAADAGEQAAASKAAKNARSKDRRRRGKDPAKLLPAAPAKKDKGRKKGAQGGAIPQIIEPAAASQDESRSTETASPSTSRSSSMCASRNPNLLNVAEPDEGEPEDTDDVQTPVVPALGASTSAPAIYDTDTPFQGHALSTSQTEPSFALAALTPALVSSASSSSSSTMPATPQSQTLQTLQPSISMYPHYAPPSPSRSRSPHGRMQGSWDYDSSHMHMHMHMPAPDPAPAYRKPPRFRSTSRGSAGSALGTGLGTGLEMPAPTALPTSASYPPTEMLPTFAFPSLNNPSPAADFELRPPPASVSRPGSAASMRARAGPNANPNANAHTHMHRASSSALANSPLRTPTPSQMHPQSPLASSFAAAPSSAASSAVGTAVSVSAQTQLASLRGALEAARLREEKGRQEVERLHRECADLRWRWSEDAGRWSRREMELQNYIQMLTRQLHAYASVAADPQLQMSPPASYVNGAMLPSGIPPSVYAATSSHSQPPSPSPAPEAQLPAHPSQPSSRPPTQPQSPSILGPLSPFTQQAFPPAHFPHQHPHGQRGQEMPLQAPPPHGYGYANPNHNANSHSSAFSLFYPGAGSGSGYSSPSASPVIGAGRGIEGDGSPLGDRGRRRGRARTHTASQLDRHDAEGSGSGSGSGSGNSNSNGGRDVFRADDGEEEEEEEINGVLADAILKRPESIRNGSFGSLRKRTSGGEQRRGAVSLNEDGEQGAAVHPKEEDGWVRPPDAPAPAVEVS